MCQSTIYKAPRIIKHIANGIFFFHFLDYSQQSNQRKHSDVTDIVTLTISCSTEFENLAFLSFCELKQRNQKHNKQEHKYLATAPYQKRKPKQRKKLQNYEKKNCGAVKLIVRLMVSLLVESLQSDFQYQIYIDILGQIVFNLPRSVWL